MCLAIPGKVKKINGREVIVEYPGQERKVMVGDDVINIGDYVLVQMGIIVKTISKEEAAVSLKAWTQNQ